METRASQRLAPHSHMNAAFVSRWSGTVSPQSLARLLMSTVETP